MLALLLIQLIVHKKEDKTFLSNSGRIEANITKHDLTFSLVNEKLEKMKKEMRNISLSHSGEGDLVLKASVIFPAPPN